MILIDYSQFAITSVIANSKHDDVSEEMLRHLILNQIRANRAKFSREYGELVFAIDDRSQWRKRYFKEYKANRRKSRSDSDLDWKEIYRIMDLLIEEFRATFPYKFIRVEGAEGDDVIGTLARHITTEKILILSSDKDFKQLQKNTNVKQYDPFHSKWIREASPELYLREHIIRGDDGDGVPNFLSPDDVFVTPDKRQKSIMSKKVVEWLAVSEDEFYRSITEEQQSNYTRNKMMIDLGKTPDDIQSAILEEFNKPVEGHRSKIMGYFIKHRMKMLMKCLTDF